MIDGTVKPGTAVKSSKWPEPVILEFVEKIGDYYRIVGSTFNSRQHINQILSESEYLSLGPPSSLLAIWTDFL